MQHMVNISLLRVKKGLLTGLALVSIVVMHDPQAFGPQNQKIISTGVLLGLRNLLLPTIGLHHMNGRFLHLLILLRIKCPLDHHWDHQKAHHQTRRPIESSCGPEVKRLNLDPSLCLLLTQKPSLGGHSFPDNRSLPLYTLLSVSWKRCHIWITYERVIRNTIIMRKSYGA